MVVAQIDVTPPIQSLGYKPVHYATTSWALHVAPRNTSNTLDTYNLALASNFYLVCSEVKTVNTVNTTASAVEWPTELLVAAEVTTIFQPK